MRQLFDVGDELDIHVDARAAIEKNGLTVASILARHASGDWGEVGEHDLFEVTQDDVQRFRDRENQSQGSWNKCVILASEGYVQSEYTLPDGAKIDVSTFLCLSGAVTWVWPGSGCPSASLSDYRECD